MTVYITKYALTDGIIQREVKVSSVSDKMVVDIQTRYGITYHKPFWHETNEEAIAHAEIMRKRKIESLKKSIVKLEKLDFTDK